MGVKMERIWKTSVSLVLVYVMMVKPASSPHSSSTTMNCRLARERLQLVKLLIKMVFIRGMKYPREALSPFQHTFHPF